MEPEASTTKRTRLPSRPSRVAWRRSSLRITRPRPARPRAFWCGAAACTVAARCSFVSWPRGRWAPVVRPWAVRARERRPAAPSPSPGTLSILVRNGSAARTAACSGPPSSWAEDCRGASGESAGASAGSAGGCASWGPPPCGGTPPPPSGPPPSSGPCGFSGPPSGPGSGSVPGSGSGSGSFSGSSSGKRSRISSSLSSSRPGASKGLRRRRWGSASSAACRTSSFSTAVRPAHAASAVAVRAITMSARMPSTSKPAQVAAICRSALSPRRTCGSSARAATTRARTSLSSPDQRAAKPAGSSS